MLLSPFPLTFLQIQKRMPPFHRTAYDYSLVVWDGTRDHSRDIPWEDNFKLNASAAGPDFCESVQIGVGQLPF